MMNAILPSAEGQSRPLLVCMLPARNAARDLPDYLACVDTFCDAIVALDDGSTDETYDILAAHPSVKILLSNPMREDYRGWDDAANRNRLLEAVESLNPEWLISLDADERIDARDASSIRHFLETDALPGFAYGFRHVPMRNDDEHFIPTYQWVYRLFSHAPGQRFPNQKLHFIPVPTSIPRICWIRTTLRIQHLGGLTPGHRLTRFNKYLEADPLRTWQADYSHLLDMPGVEEIRRWEPRPASVPVLLESEFDDDMTSEQDPGIPAMSAIIISRNNEDTIAASVAAVVQQEMPEPFEVIVVTSGTDRTAEIVRQAFPEVTVVQLPGVVLPGEARNAGLAVARGQFVSFPGSHVELQSGSLAARLRAHRRGYAMVTSIATNGTLTPAGWASYFLDHSEGLPGHKAAEFNGPPAKCSYARLPLLEVGAFPEGVRTGEDTAVNRALVKRGYVAYREPDAMYIHTTRCTTVPRLLRHHFQRGRGVGRLLLADYRRQGRLLNQQVLRTRLLDAVPQRLERMHRSVMLANQEIVAEYERVRPLIALGAIATLAGTWYEIVRPGRGKLSVLLGRPVVNVLLVGGEPGARRLALAQIDEVGGQATMQSLSPELVVPHGNESLSLPAFLETSPGIQGFRHAIGTALRLDSLECVIDPELDTGDRPAPVTRDFPDALSLTGVRDRLVEVVRAGGALNTSRRRSTLSLWGTARVLARLRPFSGDR
ncbi:MAG TPA: glycosyltransferase [Thermomicrobiales bacterium]|nr:glycosyltransferase [Thermomicrobiales bacterium]